MRHIKLFNIPSPKAVIADAGPDIPGGDGANDGFWRKQWKDRLKRFADMGRGVKFKVRLSNGKVVRAVGKFQGSKEGDATYGRVLVKGDPNLPDGYYEVHSDNGETVVATLSETTLKRLGIARDEKNKFIPARDDAAIQDIGTMGYEPIAEGESPKPRVLKKKMSGAEAQARKMKTVTDNLKEEGRFPVPRQTTSDRWGVDSDIALGAKEDYNLVYEQLKDEDEAWKEKYPTFDDFWNRVQELSVGDTTQSPNSLDEIPQEMKDINKAYATRILGLEPDGKITFYRNAVNQAATPENAARGYVTTNADFAYDYNADAANVGTNGRYEIDAQPDEVFGMLGYSKLEDEFGVVVGDGVTQQPGRIRRVGDLEPPKLAPWVEKYQAAVGRSTGGTPYRHHALAGQFDLLPVDDFLGADLNEFLAKNKLESSAIKAKFDELYGSGAYEEFKAAGNPVTFSSIKRMFTDLGNGQIGLDITKVDGSEGGNLAPAGYGDAGDPDSFKNDQLDANLKMLAVFQELSGKPFMIHRDNAAGQKLVDKQPVDEMTAALADPFRTKPIENKTYAPVAEQADLGFEDEFEAPKPKPFRSLASEAETNAIEYVKAVLKDPKKKKRFKKILNELEAAPGEDIKLADGWEAMDPREAFARQYGTTIDELREFLDLDIDSPEVDAPLYNDAKRFLFGQYRQWEDAMASNKRLAVKSLRSDVYLHENGTEIIREYFHSRKSAEEPFDDGYAVGGRFSVEAASRYYNELHAAAPLESPVRIFLSDDSYNTSFGAILDEEHGEGTYKAATAFATGTDRIVVNMSNPILHSEEGDKLAVETLKGLLKEGKEVDFPFSLEEIDAIEDFSYYKYVLSHEYGHLFDHTYLHIRRDEDQRVDEGPTSKKYNEIFHSHEHDPSGYGETNVSEFFAEHFSYYLLTGKAKHPDVELDIKQHFGISTLPTDKKPIKAAPPKTPEASDEPDIPEVTHLFENQPEGGRFSITSTTFDSDHTFTDEEYQVLEWFTDGGYEYVSDYLRDGKNVSDNHKKGIEILLNLIDQSEVTNEGIIYRGRPVFSETQWQEIANYKVGDTFTDSGVGSHSRDGDRAEFYYDIQYSSKVFGKVFYRLSLNKGDKAFIIPDDASSYGASEEEVILPPGTKYKITGVHDLDGNRVFDVEVLEQEPKKPNIDDYSSQLPTVSSEVSSALAGPIPVPTPIQALPKAKPKEKVDRNKLPTPDVEVNQPVYNIFNNDEPDFVDGNIIVPDSPEARALSKLGRDPSEKEREDLREKTLEVLTTDPNYKPLPPKDADFDALTSVGESAFTYVDSSLAINDGLRDADYTMENSKQVKDLDEAMLLSAHLPPGATVYRMLKLSTWKRLNPQVGGVMIDRAFISTSHTRVFSDEAREIDVMTGDVNQIPMRIVMPSNTAGIDLSTISWYDTEDEYLLPRQTALRFLGWDSEGYAVFERIS